MATVAAPSTIPRTTAIAPPPSQRNAPTWWAASAVAVRGSSAAGRTCTIVAHGGDRPRRNVERMSTEGPATLAAWLRGRSDEQLAGLLTARARLSAPAPRGGLA